MLLSTYAGGRQTHTETRSLGFDPTAPMALYLNSWFPAWLAGTPSPGAATRVDRVDVTP